MVTRNCTFVKAAPEMLLTVTEKDPELPQTVRLGGLLKVKVALPPCPRSEKKQIKNENIKTIG